MFITPLRTADGVRYLVVATSVVLTFCFFFFLSLIQSIFTTMSKDKQFA